MSKLYIGQVERKVDDHFRIRIPCKFKQGDDKQHGYFIIYKSADNVVLLYPYNYVADVAADTASEGDIMAEGSRVKLDGYGKILIPKNMRSFLDDTKTVFIIGAYDHMEIYSKTQYDMIVDKYKHGTKNK